MAITKADQAVNTKGPAKLVVLLLSQVLRCLVQQRFSYGALRQRDFMRYLNKRFWSIPLLDDFQLTAGS